MHGRLNPSAHISISYYCVSLWPYRVCAACGGIWIDNKENAKYGENNHIMYRSCIVCIFTYIKGILHYIIVAHLFSGMNTQPGCRPLTEAWARQFHTYFIMYFMLSSVLITWLIYSRKQYQIDLYWLSWCWGRTIVENWVIVMGAAGNLAMHRARASTAMPLPSMIKNGFIHLWHLGVPKYKSLGLKTQQQYAI